MTSNNEKLLADQRDRLSKLSPEQQALFQQLLRQKAAASAAPEIEPIARDGEMELSFSQHRQWFLEQLEPETSAYNLSLAVDIRRPLSPAILQASFGEIVCRHEALRTTFRVSDGDPHQIIAPNFDLRLPIVDLAGLSADVQDSARRKLIRCEGRRPFRLSQGPLLRTTLVRLGPNSYLLLLTLHHIISDGWSMELMLTELAELYGALSSDRPPQLPELKIQYADYAAWQRRQLTGEALEKHLGYWRDRLQMTLPVLELPTDTPRPAFQTYRGGSCPLSLEDNLTVAIRTLSQRREATPFMILLAALKALLSRETDQHDLCIGTYVANRQRPEIQHLIGFFVNTLALRTDLSGDPRFDELLGRVQEVTLGAYDHQELPFEKLLEELQPERATSHTPLFQVMVVYQTIRQGASGLTELAAVDGAYQNQGRANFDLTLWLWERGDSVSGRLEYNRDLFSATTVQRLAGRFQRLLASAMADPSQPLSQLPVLAPSETHQLLYEWNDRPETGVETTFLNLFEQQVEQAPHRTAVFDAETAEELTYRQLDQQSNRLAWHLIRQHLVRPGVGPEIRIGVLLERSLDLVVGLLAVLKAGGAFIPLDPTHPATRRQLLVEDADMTLVLSHRGLAGELHGPEILDLDLQRADIDAESSNAPASQTMAANAAYLIYTSGSTGRPKGVVVPHACLGWYVQAAAEHYQLKPDDRALHLSSIAFDNSVEEIFPPLTKGAAVVLRDAESLASLERFFRRCEAWKISVMSPPTTLWHEMVDALDAHPELWPSTLRLLSVGGEQILRQKVDRWHQVVGDRARLINSYGPTESTVVATLDNLTADRPEISAPIGRPMTGAGARIADRTFQLTPQGAAGELLITGGGVTRGYLGRPRQTAQSFAPDPWSPSRGARLYRTGDRVRWLADGRLQFLGRVDHQVKIRGFRVEPGEIEARLRQHSEVREAVVLAREDHPHDRRLVAYVCARENSALPSTRELRAFVGEQLPDYMMPSAIVWMEELPRGPSGKIDRGANRPNAYPAPEDERFLDAPLVSPRTPTEELIAGIWSEILGMDPASQTAISVHDNFFELGGHSLLATRVMARLSESFGTDLELRSFFEAPTIAGQAEVLEHATRDPVPPIVPVSRDCELPLSFPQERIWFLNQLDPDSTAYHVPRAYRLGGQLNLTSLRQAYGELTQRHEILRTNFPERGGHPYQHIHPVRPPDMTIVDLEGLNSTDCNSEVDAWVRCEGKRLFDLALDTLIRIVVLKLAQDDHVVIQTEHHLVHDGWAEGILMADLVTYYAAFSEGHPAQLPELPIQFADFAYWQRQWLQGEVLESQLAFWRQQLADAPAMLELPTDRPRPAIQGSQGDELVRTLSGSLSTLLRDISRSHGSTLFMTLASAFEILMQRYSGQHDIVLGTGVANRRRQETEGMLGMVINTLSLRTDVSGDPTFEELLARVREVCLGAYAHQDVPFSKVVDAVRPERALSHSPIFQVFFAFQDAPLAETPYEGDLTFEALGHHNRSSKFDLLVIAVPHAERRVGSDPETAPGQHVTLLWEYDVDLFDTSTIVRMANHYETLLAEVVTDTTLRIEQLPLLTGRERHQLLVEWNDTVSSPTAQAGWTELFVSSTRRVPDAVALQVGDCALSYRELDRRSDHLADQLRVEGVETGTRVGLALRRSADLVVSLIAVWKTGATYVPIDPAYPEARRRFMLEDSEATLVLTDEGREPLSSSVKALTLSALQAVTPEPVDRVTATVHDTDLPSHLIFTSGSTGRPKGVVIRHASVAALCHWGRSAFSDEELAGVLATTSICFDLSVFEIFVPLSWGGRVILADHALDLPPSTATLINTVPSAMAELVRLDQLPSTLRTVNLAGEPWPAPLSEAIWRQTNAQRQLNLYGPSEDTTYSTVAELAAGSQGSPPIGRPIADTRAYLLSPGLQLLPQGAIGELFLAGRGLAIGYHRRPRRTAEGFVPNPWSRLPGRRLYRTGDLARYLTDGQMTFLGRNDHQVKIRGFRIELGEVEAKLAAHPAVLEVVAWVDEADGADRRLVAAVVTESPQPTVGELRDALASTLPNHLVPSMILFLDAIPRLPNGKVNRGALADSVPSGPALEPSSQRSPSTPTEELIAGIWSQILNLEGDQFGVDEDFFELGGHSLLATQVLSRLRQALTVDIPLRRLFQARTVATLARLVDRQRVAGPKADDPPIRKQTHDQPHPLSFAQERLWFLDRLESLSSAYNVPAAVRIGGNLDNAVLTACLMEIVRRHEVLRTTFRDLNGRPEQHVGPSVGWRLPVIDLSALSAVARHSTSELLAATEAERPFDLSAGPLLRTLLIRHQPDDHLLVVNLHHIVADGWSLGIMVKELAALYAAFLAGRPSPLAELPIQYGDFTCWQRAWLEAGELERQLTAWRQQLVGAPTVLELPTDRPRPSVQSYRGARQSVALSPELSDQLLEQSRAQDVTLFMTLLASFAVVLSRHSGQEDLLIGTPIANRNRIELEELIGFFANTLALRVDLSAAATSQDLLAAVRRRALAAYAHQDLPFEKLVDALEPQRDLSRQPLFQVMLVLQNAPRKTVESAGLELQFLPLDPPTSKFDLLLMLSESPRGLRGHLEYSTDLFDETTIRRLGIHFERTLRTLAAADGTALGNWSLLDAAERHQLLMAWGRPDADTVRTHLAHQRFEIQAQATPDALAACYAGTALTYRQLDRRANQLARQLRRLGVGVETRVALALTRSLDLAVAVLGVLKAGAACVPLDPDYPAERLRFMLEDSGAELVIRHRQSPLELPASNHLTVCLDADRSRIEQQDASPLAINATSAALAYVIYTSGSTGRPKGVAMPHGVLANLVAWQLSGDDAGKPCRTLQFAALSFDVSFQEMLTTWSAGGTLCLIPESTRRHADELLAELQRLAIERLFIPPIALQQLAQVARSRGEVPPTLQEIIAAGEQLQVAGPVADFFAQLSGCTLANHYGPSETHAVSGCRLTGSVADWPTLPTIGRPISSTHLYLLDNRAAPAPTGVTAQLWIGGGAVARGYHQRPKETADRFLPDPFTETPGCRMYRTGDLARFLADGGIEYLGRADSQVKIRGYRIEPGEVETVLSNHPNVRETAVAVHPDATGRPALVAYVVARDTSDDEPQKIANLRQFLQQQLPEFMVPARIMTLDSLPRTPSQKVDRRALPAPTGRFTTLDPTHVTPGSPIEEALAAIWSELLACPPPGVNDDFFSLGGHSLLAVQLTARIEQAFGTNIALRSLFEGPTIAELARNIAAQREAGKGATPDNATHLPLVEPSPADQHQSFPLTDVQQAYWIGRQSNLDLGAVATHLYFERDFNQLDVARLNAAWRQLINRHDMLRAVVLADGTQKILSVVPLYKIGVLDLRTIPRVHAETALLALRQKMSHQMLPADRWPLFDLRASRLRDGQVRLHVSLDMLFGDAWSLRILGREITRCYTEPDFEPKPLELSFRDYVLGLEALKQTQAYARDAAYWRQRLASLPPAPQLPLAKEPSAVEQPRFHRRSARLSAGSWKRLKQRATAAGLTPSSLLLAAFSEVLATWSKSPRFTLNLTLFNRLPLHSEVQQVVGDFTSLTLLEVDISKPEPFIDRARRLGRQLWDDLDHRLFSGLQVMRELARQQGHSGPLMPVVFTSILNPPEPTQGTTSTEDNGGSDEIGFSITQTPQVWLDHQVREVNGELSYNWDTVDELFPAGLLDDAFFAYSQLLEQLAASDEVWQAHHLSLVPEAQLALRAATNVTAAPYPSGLLHDGFLAQADRRPEAIAVMAADREICFGDLAVGCRRLGHHLRAAGARPNRLVAVVMEKGWEQVLAVLGILQSGAAYLPIDAGLPAARRHFLLDHGEVDLALIQPGLRNRLEWPDGVELLEIDEHWLDVDDETTPASKPFHRGAKPDDLAYVIFTSGSSGQPKGVMIEHLGAVNTVVDINQRFGVGPGDRVLGISALNFDLSVYDIFGTLAAGATLVLPEPFQNPEPRAWLEVLEGQRVTVWNSVPALLEIVVEAAPAGVDLSSLRLAMLSGDWIPLSLPHRIRSLTDHNSRRAPLQIVSLGGATEASIWSIHHPIAAVEPSWASIPYGKPMVHQTFHVLDETLQPCPVWTPGDLYIGGIGLARGYWRDPEKTANAFLEVANHKTLPHESRIYRTGDKGRYLPDGSIEFLGREDLQVKIRGHRIELAEIEAALSDQSEVGSTAVLAIGERRALSHLIAFIVPATSTPSDSTATIVVDPRFSSLLTATVLADWEPPGSQPITDKLAQIDFKLGEPGLRADHKGELRVSLQRSEDPRFLELFRTRRSYREFDPRPMPVSDLVAALDTLDPPGCGIDPRITILVCIQPDRIAAHVAGLYRYRHGAGLSLVTDGATMHPGDTPPVNQPILDQAAFGIFFAAALDGPETQTLDEELLLIQAGALSQQLLERSPSPLGFCPIGSYDFPRLRQASALDDSVELLHCLFGGVIERPVENNSQADNSLPHLTPEKTSNATLPLATVGHFLSAVSQVVLPEFDLPKYRYPSAGNLYPIQIYVQVPGGQVPGLDGGVYYHHPKRHELVRLATQPSLDSDALSDSVIALYLVAKPNAITPIYRDLARPLGLLEAGYMQQLLATAADEIGLVVRPLEVAPTVRSTRFDPEERLILIGGLIVEPIVTPTTDTTERDLASHLREALRESLPHYMVPDRIVQLDALPLNANGKIDRNALHRHAATLDTLEGALPQDQTQLTPRSERELLICALIADLLDLPKVDLHDNFFELGGHSVTATRLAAKIESAFQVVVPLRDLFDRPTAAQMAELVDQQRASGWQKEPLPQLLRRDLQARHQPFPLTDVQEAYWIGRSSALELSQVASHAYFEVDLPDLDIARLTHACRRLVARHEMLRAIIRPDGLQQILATVPPYEIPLVDLTTAGPSETERGLQDVRRVMSHQVLASDRWPLFGIRASRRDRRWLRLHVSLDLLIGDAWSFQLMRDELALIYLDPDIELPPLELSFRDYVLAEHALRDHSVYQRALNYWRGRLPTLPAAPELPLAMSPAAIKQPTFVRRSGRLAPAAWQQLQQRASRASLTPSIVLMAAFAEVLATWSKSRSFTLNLTLFNRLPLDPQVQQIVGDFTSLTLLELHVPAAESFVDRARRHQRQLWDDLDHRLVSGVRVLREWGRQRGGTPTALAPVVFTSILHQRTQDEEPADEEDQGSAGFGVSQTPQVWLDHQVRERRGALLYSWDAVEELFPADLLDEMFRSFEGLLQHLADNEEAWQETRGTLVPAAQIATRVAANATSEPLPDGLLHSRFLACAQRNRQAPAVIAADRTLSYGELDDGSAQIANQLQQAGVSAGDIVAVVMEKGWQQVVAVLAVLRAGAAYLPCDPALPADRRRYLLDHGQAEVVLTQSWLVDSFDWTPGVPILPIDESCLEAAVSESFLESNSTTADALAYVIFTSGSSGQPKGVMVHHQGALNTILDLNRRLKVGPQDRVLALSSLSFDLSVYDIFGPLAAGAAIVMPAPGTTRDPAHWATLVRRHRVTLWNSVPALMEMLVEYVASRNDCDLSNLRLALWSGDWVPIDLPTRTRALFAPDQAPELFSLGGATEASIWSILYPIKDVAPQWISIPYGRPMVNQTFHVLDSDLQPCPVWTPGELYIGGAGLALGYWRDARQTASRFIAMPVGLPGVAGSASSPRRDELSPGQRLYRTGDLGRYLPDGTIEFLGREDSQVKIRGHRIELGEIEAALLDHPAVTSTVVEAMGDARSLQRLVAGIVVEASAEAAAEALLFEELRITLTNRLPDYMVPTEFLRMKTMPLTANGKVDRTAFQRLARAASQVEAPEDHTLRAPATEMEQILSGIWRQVLGHDSIARDANFFEIGGTSVQLVRAYNLLRQAIDQEFVLVELFQHPTITALANFLTPEQPATSPTDAAEAQPSRRDLVADRKSKRKQRRQARLTRRGMVDDQRGPDRD